MEKDFRAEIGALVQDRKQAYTAMSDRIWGFAEPRFQEYDSSRLQQEYLKARGFSIRADLAGEETAFIAEYGSGKPVLAFLGEFDALSSLEQEADSTERRPVPGKTNGHGCGHHLLGTAAVAAADFWAPSGITAVRQRKMPAERRIWCGTAFLMIVMPPLPGIQAPPIRP